MTLAPYEVQGDVFVRICQLADDMALLIGTLKLDPASMPAARLVALTRPFPSTRFRISNAQVNAIPRQLLAADPLRVSFSVILTSGVIYQFASEQFAPAAVGSIDGTNTAAFGFDGHVGELWGSANSVDTVTLIEQTADTPL